MHTLWQTNHEAKQCWLNPSSSPYRPELASKAAAKATLNPPPGLADPPPGLAGSSASSSSNNSRAAAALDVPVEVTQNIAQFAGGAWALD